MNDIRNKCVSQNYEILLQLLSLSNTLWEESRIFFAKYKISPSQFNVLNQLYENRTGINQIELSRRLLMHRSNITGLLKRLEKRRYVKRKQSMQDKRAILVTISPEGCALVEKILPEFFSLINNIFSNVEIKNRNDFIETLKQIEVNTLCEADKLKRTI
ncbi:MAG TPA: MarR family transcriptional regulator [Verrucomicrobiota bacterium]|nr:MarR family transcriptional regulator [Verrucomicrobiota bacterium]